MKTEVGHARCGGRPTARLKGVGRTAREPGVEVVHQQAPSIFSMYLRDVTFSWKRVRIFSTMTPLSSA